MRIKKAGNRPVGRKHAAAAGIVLGMLSVCGLLLGGCGSSTPQTATIALPANPTTGYTWEVTQTEELFEITHEYQQGTPGSGAASEADAAEGEAETLVGAGGTEVFTLTPKAKGETEVTLAYAREWEDEEPLSSITYTLKVDRRMQIKMISATGALDRDADTVPALPELEIR